MNILTFYALWVCIYKHLKFINQLCRHFYNSYYVTVAVIKFPQLQLDKKLKIKCNTGTQKYTQTHKISYYDGSINFNVLITI